ncbi:AbrB/MazE/SpoVT family DNA-binding domain-containing protein [Romeria aff. gracilis LEGE 07310]|uniref:AbrB/MazE/SpoVT family DNA-binding domain-containing protein n=1 Tax=Vasconcelosia minhoensis LEGE 07310 TaxID=915328 RepID=A0A8J7ALI6_9CYAN|nr:AbrB/MazE/SpoVT family DNA-binding domain-containing protein [Romeria gracilis]MBE9077220.1 AbrB/MazE/SpoVT family DNA-binding domain-containing protein [Romeria aff. gracilis LEGE 07310]
MKIQIQKWGNCLAVRIPEAIAQEMGITCGSMVELALERGKLTIRPAVDSPFSLDELLSEITKSNIHSEIETGAAEGNEVW